MSENNTTNNGVYAEEVATWSGFKRGSPDSKSYTITRVNPESWQTVREGCILGFNVPCNCHVYDIRCDEIVYPVNQEIK